jgi:hypothetical protein
MEAVARVVYSRFFPDWTKPQTGRLNKSPHTVAVIANRHRPKSDSAFRRGDGHFPPAVFAIFFSAFIAAVAVRRAALRFRLRAVCLGLSVYGLIGALLSRLLIRLSFPHFFK